MTKAHPVDSPFLKKKGESMRVLGLAELKFGEPREHPLMTFASFKEELNNLHPHQRQWAYRSLPDGMKFMEIAWGVRHKPGQLEEATDILLRQTLTYLWGFATGAANQTIYWRVAPDLVVWNEERVIEYRDDGPDRCNLTDKRCVMDRSHDIVKIYFRIAASSISDDEVNKRLATMGADGAVARPILALENMVH